MRLKTSTSMSDPKQADLPEAVYHGRGVDRHDLDEIFEIGITGRHPEKPASHPAKPSVPGLVYLTTHYPVFYGLLNADQQHSCYGAVFEIDSASLEARKFLPDEDFLDEAALKGEIPRPWVELPTSTPDVPRLNPRMYGAHWRESMARLGNFSVEGPVPLDAVSRIVLVRRRDDLLQWLHLDEHITIDSAPSMKTFHGAILNVYLDDVMPDPAVVYEIIPSADSNSMEAFASDARQVLAAALPAVIERPRAGWNIEALHCWYDTFQRLN